MTKSISERKKESMSSQDVLEWLFELGIEFEQIACSEIWSKFKIILLMVYIDIFSQLWWDYFEMNTINTTQKNKFSSWLEKFLFDESNSTFVTQKFEFIGLNG
ncbi:MAG: hypothetical protein F4Y34_01610, partial [Gammaproteobacteria bacterium]|nr:hypothetical protein [Gammaproteobacteria bacterium]